jgi:hypothetical protein
LIRQMSGERVGVNRCFDICTDARKGEWHMHPDFVLGVDDGCQPVSLPDITPRKIDDRRQARKVPAPIGRPAHKRLQKIQLIDVGERSWINDQIAALRQQRNGAYRNSINPRLIRHPLPDHVSATLFSPAAAAEACDA